MCWCLAVVSLASRPASSSCEKGIVSPSGRGMCRHTQPQTSLRRSGIPTGRIPSSACWRGERSPIPLSANYSNAPESGVIFANVLDLLPARANEDPWWASSVEGFRHARADELPAGYGDGFVFDAPVIDTSIYLNYLRAQFESAGGIIVENQDSERPRRSLRGVRRGGQLHRAGRARTGA